MIEAAEPQLADLSADLQRVLSKLFSVLRRGDHRGADGPDLTLAQLAMAANAPMLTKAAMVDGRPEVGILPTGQAVGAIEGLPSVAELMSAIEADARAALARACGGGSPDGGSD